MIIKVIASSSKGNCVYISDGKTAMLLDCGLPFQKIKRALNYQTSKIEAVLQTHSHRDHCKGVEGAIEMGIDIYCTEQTRKETNINGHRVKIIKPLETFKVGTFTVKPFDTPHDVENVGFLIQSQSNEKALYLTDTPFCKYRFRGLTCILVEVNYSLDILEQNIRSGLVGIAVAKRILANHFNLKTAIDFLKANDLSRVEEIFLLHLSDNNSIAQIFKSGVQQATGIPTFIGEV